MSWLVDAFKRGNFPKPPVAKLIGIEVTSIEEGRVTAELTVDERHANPMGTLHGGILCDLADAAMGLTHASTLEQGETFTTLELKINFLKPVWKGTLTATATIVKRGRTIGLVQCDVTDQGGSLVAHAVSTCMTLRGQDAQGRTI